jgi:hypothetical protein
MLKRQLALTVQEALKDLPRSIRNPLIHKWVAEWSGLVQPLWVSSRIRILKLNNHQIEVLIPVNFFTCAIARRVELEESFLMLAANQGLKFFLHQLKDKLQVKGLRDFRLEIFESPIQGPLRFKMQLSEAQIEELRNRVFQDTNHELDLELFGQYFSHEHKLVAIGHWTAKVKRVWQIEPS